MMSQFLSLRPLLDLKNKIKMFQGQLALSQRPHNARCLKTCMLITLIDPDTFMPVSVF